MLNPDQTQDFDALLPGQSTLDGANRRTALKAPVLGLYGGQDGGIPLSTINQMKDALAEAGAKGNAAARASAGLKFHALGWLYRHESSRERTAHVD